MVSEQRQLGTGVRSFTAHYQPAPAATAATGAGAYAMVRLSSLSAWLRAGRGGSERGR